MSTAFCRAPPSRRRTAGLQAGQARRDIEFAAPELEDRFKKKSRFSGKNRLKRVRFTCWSSIFVAEKSVLIVSDAFSDGALVEDVERRIVLGVAGISRRAREDVWR
jgi:hypothetical protein